MLHRYGTHSNNGDASPSNIRCSVAGREVGEDVALEGVNRVRGGLAKETPSSICLWWLAGHALMEQPFIGSYLHLSLCRCDGKEANWKYIASAQLDLRPPPKANITRNAST